MDRAKTLEKYRWNLNSLYESIDCWKEDISKLEKLGNEIEKFSGKLKEDKNNVKKVLDMYFESERLIGRIYTFSKMTQDENTRLSNSQSMVDRSEKMSVYINEKTSYIESELLKLDLDELISSKELTEYRHYLENLNREKSHILSKVEENLLASMGEIANIPENTFGVLNDADLDFGEITNEQGKKEKLTHGNYIKFLESKNRDIRKEAFITMYKSYSQLKNTFSSLLKGQVKKNIFYSKVRKYSSALEMSLMSGNIPTKVYETLVKSVEESIEKLHWYVSFRKKVLKLQDIHMYDLYVPLVEELDIKIEYEEGKKLLLESLEVLGSEYVSIVKEGLESNWIDVYEGEGKRSGAYSWGSYDSNPYILMNYKNRLDDVFTLAHEMGHSIHSYYTRKSQPYVYGGYSIFLAEIASTVNEIILINYMIEKSKDLNERKYLLNYYIEQFRGTIFRQTMFAEFEMDIHRMVEKDEDLNIDILNEKYYNLNKKYFGEDIVIDKDISIEWARIPHFYYNFYVYQYATGFSIACYFADEIIKGNMEVRDKYIEFLKSGSSDYSIDILKKAGVDITDKKVYESALNIFKDLLKEYKELYEQK